MLKLDETQWALLQLPNPWTYLPELAVTLRTHHADRVQHWNNSELLGELDRSWRHAAGDLRITHLPTLVEWTLLDVASNGGLRRDAAADLFMRKARHPNLAARDMLSAAAAQGRNGASR